MTDPVFTSFAELPREQHALTIGSFDGVHRGHQYLLQQVIDKAARHSAASLAITFDPLPAEVLRPDKAPPRLCTTSDRARAILDCGIDRVLVLTFDDTLSHQSAEDFLGDVHRHAEPKAIVVGEDFAFGYQRKGTPQFLSEQADRFGYELQIVDRINPDGLELSSSTVRRALAEAGDVSIAQNVLGRPFRLRGTVENGDHRGRVLGYPTANLDIPGYMTLPRDGIYAGLVSGNEAGAPAEQPALVYVGTRPTFWQTRRLVEVYLIDFAGDLYGTELSVDFLERIRGDQRFASPEELVDQMHRDESAGREIFKRLGVLDTIRR